MKEVTIVSSGRSRTLLGGAVASFVVCASLAACSGASNSGLFGDVSEGGTGLEGSIPGAEGGPFEDGGGDGSKPCTGIECDKPACKDGETTSLRGKVYDPAGANVLYGVVVYVPSGPLAPLPKGASCDPCGGAITPAPLAVTRTDTKGEFVLTDVPVGAAVPIVIQTGKWRRTIEVPITKSCQANDAPDKLRLPRNGSEGEMPQIAVTTGGCDALECLLRGIGIDDKEFVPGASSAGHVHVFNGEGGQFPAAPNAGGTTAAPLGGELWNSAAKLAPYDTLLLSCECSEANDNKGGAIGAAVARQAMHDYAASGGRVIASHYHYTWLKNSPQTDWQQIANWTPSAGGASGAFDVDTSFARGKAFSDWLVSVNASSTPGVITLQDVTNSMSSVNPPAQSWIKKGNDQVRYFSFATPIGGAECGRVAFTDLHTSGISSGGGVFPTGCPSAGGLTAQQKALEFLLFDLASCK